MTKLTTGEMLIVASIIGVLIWALLIWAVFTV